jgi:hypothetical protein
MVDQRRRPSKVQQQGDNERTYFKGHRQSKVQPKVRLPSDLHKRLVQQADKARRSLNQEIVIRLEESFRRVPMEELTDTANELLLKIMAAGDKLNADLDQLIAETKK